MQETPIYILVLLFASISGCLVLAIKSYFDSAHIAAKELNDRFLEFDRRAYEEAQESIVTKETQFRQVWDAYATLHREVEELQSANKSPRK